MNRLSEVGPSGERLPEGSARALADLARAAYLLLNKPMMQVNFEVHHAVDNPGYLNRLISTKEETTFVETISSRANGIALVVGTSVDTLPAELLHRDHGGGAVVELKERGNERGKAFRGIARPNLTFLYESYPRIEGIIVVEDEPRKLLLRHGLAVREVLREVAETAARRQRPLLSLQCPVQVPPHDYTVERDGPQGAFGTSPRVASLAVRFSIALDTPGAKVGIEMSESLSKFCESHGYGFFLADTRPGYRTGNWFLVRAHDRKRARSSFSLAADRGAVSGAEGCVPVTFVGPARWGSTHAVIAFLSQFPEVGILACSITLLDDLAFIHLQLTINGASRPLLAKLNEKITSFGEPGGEPADVLRKLLPELTYGAALGSRASNLEKQLAEKAGDFHTIVGPALPVVSDHRSRRVAVWFSWQMRQSDLGLKVPLGALLRAIDTIGLSDDVPADAASIEYLMSRHLGNAVIRGKGKLSIAPGVVDRTFHGFPLQSSLARLCVRLEEAWRAELPHTKASSVIEVSVERLENCLGHWSSWSRGDD
ncbi:hypothetical protein L3Q67_02500 [Saccharothrix sp. AJ9571]|nr:hypothetical protein L3Q67_02500 [Saccharothrix sp. AJ9571]